MTDLSNYAENILAGYIAGVAPPTPPASLYVALFSSSPGEDGTSSSEVTTSVRLGGRLPVTFDAPVAGKITSNIAVNFGNSAGAVTVSHVGLFDAQSGGNFWAYRALSAPRNIQANAPVSFGLGTISIQID